MKLRWTLPLGLAIAFTKFTADLEVRAAEIAPAEVLQHFADVAEAMYSDAHSEAIDLCARWASEAWKTPARELCKTMRFARRLDAVDKDQG